jgi:sulfite exporter TauE/SafE
LCAKKGKQTVEGKEMPEITVLTVLLFGFLLGVRHAFDADHIVAVTTIVSRTGSLLRSALVGLSWGLGHTLILFVIGFLVLVFKLVIPDKLALSMEFVVGLLLVLLGAPLVWPLVAGRKHAHWHAHGDRRHLHSHFHDDSLRHDHQHIRRPLLMGMVHGLAGSGMLTLLVLGTMSSVAQGLIFLVVFGVGSILSMVLFSGLIGLPFKFIAGLSLRLNLWLRGATGLISVALGFTIMWQVTYAGGLFLSAN